MRRRSQPRQIVISDKTHGLPYSKGLMASSLMISGLPPSEAYRIAGRIEDSLSEREVWQIKSQDLRDIAASMLSEAGEHYATTYLKWQAVEELDVPLVILIGGATGVGKSTLATQLATRLGITRVMSTDAIREVLRAAFSRDLMPTLHASSFSADEPLRVPVPADADPVIIGFREQVGAVAVGIKALITRALEERTDIIVEGAHVVPGFLEGWDREFKDAVLVPVVMMVSDEAMHRSHFHLRSIEARSRPRERYIDAFPKIRSIQNYISDLAMKHEVPVVEAFDLDSTLQDIVTIVLEKALTVAQARGEVRDFGVSDKERVLEKVSADTQTPKTPEDEWGDKKRIRLKALQLFGGRRRGS